MTALSPYQALQEQLTSVVQEIGHLVDPIATAARGEAAQLGHKVMCTREREVGGEVSVGFVILKILRPGIVPKSMLA